MPRSTGEAQSNCLVEVCRKWELTASVTAFVFDTTASNSGRVKGSATLLEARLGRPVFWLACRHHVAELHIKHANDDCRGPTAG